MPHSLVIALFQDPSAAAGAARDLRALGIPRQRVSIVARTHDEEGVLAQASDGSPGSELEDSRAASRLGELAAHLVAAVAVVIPGVGPIVADGPLAAALAKYRQQRDPRLHRAPPPADHTQQSVRHRE